MSYGKGSNPRPIDKDEYDKAFDRIFGEKPLTSLQPESRDEEDFGDTDPKPQVVTRDISDAEFVWHKSENK